MEQFGQTSGHGGRPQTDYQTPPESQAELPVARGAAPVVVVLWRGTIEILRHFGFRERAHHIAFTI